MKNMYVTIPVALIALMMFVSISDASVQEYNVRSDADALNDSIAPIKEIAEDVQVPDDPPEYKIFEEDSLPDEPIVPIDPEPDIPPVDPENPPQDDTDDGSDGSNDVGDGGSDDGSGDSGDGSDSGGDSGDDGGSNSGDDSDSGSGDGDSGEDGSGDDSGDDGGSDSGGDSDGEGSDGSSDDGSEDGDSDDGGEVIQGSSSETEDAGCYIPNGIGKIISPQVISSIGEKLSDFVGSLGLSDESSDDEADIEITDDFPTPNPVEDDTEEEHEQSKTSSSTPWYYSQNKAGTELDGQTVLILLGIISLVFVVAFCLLRKRKPAAKEVNYSKLTEGTACYPNTPKSLNEVFCIKDH
jgi:hypothetical protein